MKTIKHRSKINILFISLVLFGFQTYAQEKKETFEKSFVINQTGELSLSCYDADLKVNTWNKNEVKLIGEIIVVGGSAEDQQKLIDIFKNPKVIEGENTLSIETGMNVGFVNAFFIKTIYINGKKTDIKIDKFKTNYTLWIPESIAFNLKSKYNDIEIAPLKGKINFDLYDADLVIAGFGNDANIMLKYSKASLGKGGDAILNLYDSDIEAIELKNVEISSKYSEVIIGTLNTLDMGSYDDEIRIEKVNSLKTEAKYSNFKIKGDISNSIVDFYDSDIETGNVGQFMFSGKYSSIKAGNVNQLFIKTIYDSDIKAGDVGEFSCDESKYDYFAFSGIKTSVKMPSTYDSDLIIGKSYPTFSLFEGSFKYCSVTLPLDAAINFSLEFDATYGDIKFPRERFNKRSLLIKENSKFQFEGSVSENPSCKVKFVAYDSNISF